jgi:hypothetical protein
MTKPVRAELTKCFPEVKVDHGSKIDEIRDDTPPFICDLETTMRHTRKCTNGSSAGISGWRGEYITPFLGNPEIAAAWHSLIIRIGNAKLPPWMHPYLCGARGTALFKPTSDGKAREPGEFREGDRVRPIAAGEFLMRVASSIGCELDRDGVVAHLAPIQLGIGVPGGAEAVAWILRQRLASGPVIVVSLDEENAFQYIDRSTAVNAAIPLCPNSARMFVYEYQTPPIVHFAGDGVQHEFVSQTGVKQGHGFGSLIYALGKHSVYQAMSEVSDNVKVVSYLDNAYVVSDDAAALERSLDVWDKGTRKQGGRPNFSKCCIYYNNDSLAGGVQKLSGEFNIDVIEPQGGFEVCGVPLGDPDYVAARLQVKVGRHDRLFSALTELDPQCANLLLRNSGIPRFSFLLRSVTFDEINPFAEQFDDNVEKVFRGIADLPPDLVTGKFLQVSLRHGGFGLARQAPLAAGANLASLLLSFPILCKCFPGVDELLDEFDQSSEAKMEVDDGVSVPDRIDTWRAEAEGRGLHFVAWIIDAWEKLKALELKEGTIPDHPMELIAKPLGFFEKKAADHANPRAFRIQKHLSHAHANLIHEQLLTEVAPHKPLAARILSNQHSGASGVLRIVPVKHSLKFTPADFRAVMRIYSGNKPQVLQLPGDKACKCSEPLTLSHALSCKHLRARFVRHDALVDDVFQWLRKRRVHAVKEYYPTESGQHRVDILVRTDSTTKWCDVTVTDPSCPSYVDKAAVQEGTAAKIAEGGKNSKYRKLAERMDAIIVPLVFETSGFRGAVAEKFYREAQAASSQGPDRLELFQQLTITLQKGNVEMCREAARKAMGVRQMARRFLHARFR